MNELLNGLKRSSMCTGVTKTDLNTKVTLMGWVQRRRDLGGLIFVWLRDRTGIIQVVFDQSKYPEVFKKANELKFEYVIAVQGRVELRTPENINPDLKTGEIEVTADSLKILSESDVLPFMIDDDVVVNDNVRYKYRYLDLRRPVMQEMLRLRSRTAKAVRNYFYDEDFTEIETPVLCVSTPEGARDYLVPSRIHRGAFYALPQSPQLYKQLLMVSGFDKYFQIVKCFRDEDLRADRQPEFTQIDVEMSFVDTDDVMEVGEGLVKRVFSEVLGHEVKLPIERMTYKYAMENYGSDKPDLRFDLRITNISEIAGSCGFSVFKNAVAGGGSVRGINGKGLAAKLSRKEIDALTDLVKTYRAKGLAWMAVTSEGIRGSFQKFLTEEETASVIKAMGAEQGDILFFVADADKVVFDALGQLRLELARRFELYDKSEFRFVWITEFPMFEYSEEDGRFYAVHHPFTSPMDEDLNLPPEKYGEMRAKAYDIVLNGYELGGGSIRIHSREIQSKMFGILGFNEQQIQERFGFLTEALRYGAPPHGGFALGMDRLIMLISGTDNIKNVIAFPKMQNAMCLMTEAPTPVEQKQLDELGISITEEK